MSNVVRRDPYAMDDLFDDLFKGFFVRPLRYQGEPAQLQIRMEVKEDDKSFKVQAELPGVKKEDVHVTIDGNTVAISAEVKRESEQKEGEKVLHSERYYGKLYRGFSLGQDVDENAASARFENGILELVLPKKALTSARKLNIE